MEKNKKSKSETVVKRRISEAAGNAKDLKLVKS